MKPILTLPLILAACVATQPPCDRYRTECRPGDVRCTCERPEADERTAYTRPEPPKVEPPKPEPPKPEPPKPEPPKPEPPDREPNREKDPEGHKAWKERQR